MTVHLGDCINLKDPRDASEVASSGSIASLEYPRRTSKVVQASLLAP